MHQSLDQEHLVYSLLSSIELLKLLLEILRGVYIRNVVQDIVLHELADKSACLKVKNLPLLVCLIFPLFFQEDWAEAVLDVEQVLHIFLPGLEV